MDDCYELITEIIDGHDRNLCCKRKHELTPGSPSDVIDAYFSSDSSNDSWAVGSSSSSSSSSSSPKPLSKSRRSPTAPPAAVIAGAPAVSLLIHCEQRRHRNQPELPLSPLPPAAVPSDSQCARNPRHTVAVKPRRTPHLRSRRQRAEPRCCNHSPQQEPYNVVDEDDSDNEGSGKKKRKRSKSNFDDDDDEGYGGGNGGRRGAKRHRNSVMDYIVMEAIHTSDEEEDDDLDGDDGHKAELGIWKNLSVSCQWACLVTSSKQHIARILSSRWKLTSHVVSTPSPRSASKKLGSPFGRLSLRKFEAPEEETEHLQRPVNDPYQDIETAYVAQVCLTWEALHCQYTQLTQKISCHSAQQFQQFQVLLQRFIENEPFEMGSRPEMGYIFWIRENIN
ncbi:hypothetical protein PHJA_001559800 [Phtheirospermum japonicum]|uniref:Uncharacterized protein n=1 Tax=Phtheirospermum japonicum TaxID=374723 RepID=A0A830CDP5_9LAMI|nr:hypothetical protein PHJA_001559800 [Phtheirospermum japonicum]